MELEHKSNGEACPDCQFCQQKVHVNILSYNILADCYVRVPDQPWNSFSYCTDEAVEWKLRCPKIQAKLLASKADIICLQELTWEWSDTAFNGEGGWALPAWTRCLTHPTSQQDIAYVGVMQALPQKDITKNAERNLRSCGRRAPTGVGTFYKSSLFTEFLPASHGSGSGTTVFLQLNVENKELPIIPAAASTSTSTSAVYLLVNNVHLMGSPSKLAEQKTQLQGIIKQLTKGYNSLGREGRGTEGIEKQARAVYIVCGDFNSDVHVTPDHDSACNANNNSENSTTNDDRCSDSDSYSGSGSDSIPCSAATEIFTEHQFHRAPTGISWSSNELQCRLDHIMYRPAVDSRGDKRLGANIKLNIGASNCLPESITTTTTNTTAAAATAKSLSASTTTSMTTIIEKEVSSYLPSQQRKLLLPLPRTLPDDIEPSDHLCISCKLTFTLTLPGELSSKTDCLH